MRVGSNPKKEDPKLQGYGLHRLIMPVYIPSQEGYFAQSLDILRICLESLRLTKKPETAVTIISNGCCQPALTLLFAEQERGWINQLVVSQENRGKVDAIVGAARSCFERIVTFSDSDVMFRPGWDTAVEVVFSTFPECGLACLFPRPGGELAYTSSTLLAGIMGRTLGFTRIANDADVDTFDSSIGLTGQSQEIGRLGQIVLRRSGLTVGVGGGHFVCSLRREVMKAMPVQPALQAVCGDSETNWLDLPSDQLGYWRLATDKAYVQHMGNRLETWMPQEVAALRAAPLVTQGKTVPLGPMCRHWTAWIPYRLRARLGTFLGRRLRARFRTRAAVQAAIDLGTNRPGAEQFRV